MKKRLLLLLPILTIILLSQNVNAQQDIKNTMASTTANYDSAETINYNLNKNTKVSDVSGDYKPISIDESAFTFAVDKSFGSYVIPNTNFLKIVSPNDAKYTNVEFTNKKTGAKIFSFELDITRNVVDMSNSAPGIYSLTLSNKAGDKYTEDIMIL